MEENKNILFGFSDNLIYDIDSYYSWKQQSTAPINYMLNPESRYNKGECYPNIGLNYGFMGNNNDTLVGHGVVAKAQRLVDLESILTNRNVRNSKGRRSNLNPINPVTEFENKNDIKQCKKSIKTEYSRLSHPLHDYREMSINRFYDLGSNPQIAGVIYPFKFYTNTTLEAIDNFKGFK